MNGLIILAGGGNAAQSAIIDDYFRQQFELRGFSKCLYVPLALPVDRYEQATEWFMGLYNYMEHITTLRGPAEANDVLTHNFDVIYLGGGDTGKLLMELRTLRLDTFIIDQVAMGAIVYGGSAGAIVLGRTIETAPMDEYAANGKNDGLDLLGGYSVVPHFKGSFSQRQRTTARDHKSDLLGIGESTGVVMQDGIILEVLNPDGLKRLVVDED